MIARRIVFAVSLLVAILASMAAAQLDLVTFQAGDPIRADEVNGNFAALRDAIEARQLDTVHVSYVDLVPLNTSDLRGTDVALDYTRILDKESVLTLDVADASATFCFATRLDLPDGATISSLSAVAYDGPNSYEDDVDVLLRRRPWGETALEIVAGIDEDASDVFGADLTSASAPASAFPHAVDAAGYAYRLDVCIAGSGAGFLDAALTLGLP